MIRTTRTGDVAAAKSAPRARNGGTGRGSAADPRSTTRHMRQGLVPEKVEATASAHEVLWTRAASMPAHAAP